MDFNDVQSISNSSRYISQADWRWNECKVFDEDKQIKEKVVKVGKKKKTVRPVLKVPQDRFHLQKSQEETSVQKFSGPRHIKYIPLFL